MAHLVRKGKYVGCRALTEYCTRSGGKADGACDSNRHRERVLSGIALAGFRDNFMRSRAIDDPHSRLDDRQSRPEPRRRLAL